MTGAAGRYRVRAGRADDAKELARLQASVQLQALTRGRPHTGIADWVMDLMDGHPAAGPGDFLIAEETATGLPVAGLVGLRQDWYLSGLRLPVVQIELVGTAPQHRGNRLTEQMFAVLHQQCAADGVAIQMIEGIPHFYRRLGYDYALAHGGAVTISASPQPGSSPQLSEPMTMRPATPADADDLAAVDRHLVDRDHLFCPRDAATWRYEVAGRRPADVIGRDVAVLERNTEVHGYVVHTGRLSAIGELNVVAAACRDPAGWPLAADAMHSHLSHLGWQYAATSGQPFTAVRLLLDPAHPLALLGPPGLPTRPRGWYVRAGDPAALIAWLTPLLRKRWRAADLRWPEATMTMDTYGRAARLRFRDGKLADVTVTRGAVSPSTDPGTHAAIPGGALLQLALGHRTLPEVLDTWPDCLLRDRLTEQFLTAAFPRVPLRVWPRN